jgi:hypothetical protein
VFGGSCVSPLAVVKIQHWFFASESLEIPLDTGNASVLFGGGFSLHFLFIQGDIPILFSSSLRGSVFVSPLAKGECC